MLHPDVKTRHGATFMLLDRAIRARAERAEPSERAERAGMARGRAGLPEA